MAAQIIPLAGNSVAQGASGNPVGAAASGAGAGLGALGSILGPTTAIPIVGAVVAGLAAIAGPLLAAHAQRLNDAKTENARVAAAVPSFYQTLVQMVQSYNAGLLSPQDTITALEQLDQMTYQSLHQFVGSPGTSWNSTLPGVCNSSCTVGCCIYNTWLHPDIVGVPGKKGVIPLILAGGGTKNIGGIPSNKYGFPGYPGGSITINPPSAISSASGSIENALTSVGLPSQIGGIGIGTIALFAVGALLLRKLLA